MVVALCTAVMLRSRDCPRLPNSVCKIKFSIASAAGWMLVIPVMEGEIRAGGRMQEQEDALLFFFALWTGGVEETAVLKQVSLQPFFIIATTSFSLSLPQWLPQPGVLGL